MAELKAVPGRGRRAMDKSAIKKYAVWARNELIGQVSQKAMLYGISEEDYGDKDADSVNGYLLTATEKKQRQALISKISKDGYHQAMEEVAYTWFNRFSALRYMEVNGLIPSRVRVFTDEQNNFRPQILSEAHNLSLEGLDMERVCSLKDASRLEELYKYLLIVQCNALSSILPGLFQKIEDYTELLFPDNILREESVIGQMIALIPQEDWTEQVQIIGWLYQYYNTEPKNAVFAGLKDNIKISKENIPAATQLFTPDWIVRYMVENSLGRLWTEGHPDEGLKSEWKYYLEEAQQEPDVQKQLDAIRGEYAKIKPEDIRVIDPCMGSGHILVMMFDVLMQIYLSCGYTASDAVSSIVGKNLWGLDIDGRATQLAYFAVMMKARKYDSGFFRRKVQPNVYAIEESNGIDREEYKLFVNNDAWLKKYLDIIMDELCDAREYGSILDVTMVDFDALEKKAAGIESDSSLAYEGVQKHILPLIKVARALAQKYDVVCTNPPYMGSFGMGEKLSKFVKEFYQDSKSDLFAVFMERCQQMVRKNGYQAMITQHAWMFLSSFEKLRKKLLNTDIVSMAHLGARAFEEIGGEVVQTTSFVMRNSHIDDCKGVYCRLTEPTTQHGKEEMFLDGENRYTAVQSNFAKLPGAPVAYWVSEKFYNIFDMDNIGGYFDVKAGISTGKNESFILQWHECNFMKSSLVTNEYKYTPHNKGGEFRKWYGNREIFLKYNKSDLQQMKENDGFRHDGKEYYFRPHIGWSKITSYKSSFRYYEDGFTFDSAGLGLFSDNANKKTTLALLNSNVSEHLIALLNPTLNVTPRIVKKLPYSDINKDDLVDGCVSLSRTDWDSYETSWDFKSHPLVRKVSKISDAYDQWKEECESRFLQLKKNEEELNRIFIEIYGLQDELTPYNGSGIFDKI